MRAPFRQAVFPVLRLLQRDPPASDL